MTPGSLVPIMPLHRVLHCKTFSWQFLLRPSITPPFPFLVSITRAAWPLGSSLSLNSFIQDGGRRPGRPGCQAMNEATGEPIRRLKQWPEPHGV